jgi:hypothetical protein
MQPIYNRDGQDVTERVYSLEAWEYLPDWLRNRLYCDRKTFRETVLYAMFVSLLASGFLTAVLAFAIPWVISSVIAWLTPSSPVLEIIDHHEFYRAFGITAFPLVWAGVGVYVFLDSRRDRLTREYQFLILELAYREGQDQGHLRDSEGKFRGEPIRTPWL